MIAAPFDLKGPLPNERTLIEASAGTGKTYSIAALVTRYVAGDLAHHHDLVEGMGIEEVLVVTYTRAAAAELRDRIRAKLKVAADYLDGSALPAGDEWLVVFDAGSPRVRQRRSDRLRRALARFDEATITTIHGFCQQALAQGGLRAGAGGPGELVENEAELVAEVVRDLLLARLADAPLALSPDQQGRPPDHRSFGPSAVQRAARCRPETSSATSSPRCARCSRTPGHAASRIPRSVGSPLGGRPVSPRRSPRSSDGSERAARSATTVWSAILPAPSPTRAMARNWQPSSRRAIASSSSTSSRTPIGCSGRSSTAPSPIIG